MAEAEKESFFWRWIWDAPLLGEYVIQPVVLLFPGLCLLLAVELDENSGAAALLISAMEIAWLWALERYGRTRLVVPIIPIPWLWVFMAAAGFSMLDIVGIV